jgi:bacillithiol biosynthesis cysteine-adding enzyme BshC
VIVDPADARLKDLARPLFRKEIEEKSPVSRAVIEQSARLAAAGYPAQIALRPDMLTLFYHNPGREAIRIDGDRYSLASGAPRFALAELDALLESDITRFSPNAALRPLYQDTLFPTLSVVLGPSELAYFSQLSLAYERMGIPMPVLFPRASLTLIEPKIKKLLDKYRISFGEVLARGERIADELAKREIPDSLVGRLKDGSRDVACIWKELTEEIDRLDPTLRRTAELASGTSMKQFEFIEKKIAQAARKKDEVLRNQVEKIVSSLYPQGALQERHLNSLPFLVRYGRDVLTRAWKGIDMFLPVHHGIEIEQ